MNHITQEEPPPPTSDKDLLELMDTQEEEVCEECR